ncbi:ATP-binding protein, partial [Vibrio parahaemolyticus]|nr:ATP-binding protein [Vibrio parahaemolyticus]
EEPENNLELKYAFELAEVFRGYSKDIQIFITTHSPAFYALDK